MSPNYPTVRGPVPPGTKLEENVYVTMRDGVKIAIDIFKPLTEGRYPVILSMLPYIKEIQQQPPHLCHDIEAGATGFFVPKGYVHVIAQIRGTGFSQGQYDLFSTAQQQDGYDLIEWIARQPWCDGKVGMIGDSYIAMIQYLVAAQNPPHLRCITPYDGATDIYRDFCYQGGLFNSWFMSMWGVELIRQCLWPGEVERKLPPVNFFLDMASHPVDGPYYWERSACTKLSQIKVPVMDICPQSVMHSRGQLYAYPLIKSPKKLIILPSAGHHANEYFLTNRPLTEQILRWLDYWLKGKDTGIMQEPEVAIFNVETQEWRYENEYPLARTTWTKFYLHSSSNPTNTPSSGLISQKVPEKEKSNTYQTPPSLDEVSHTEPALVYRSEPLEKDIKVWGPLSITLYGSSTTVDTAWFVKVGDVSADGKINYLTQGHLKASLREIDAAKSKPGQPYHPFQKAVNPERGKIYEYQIELWPLFHTFKAGHRMLIRIASIDIGYQLTLHTIYASEMLPSPAENIICHDASYPSHLLLPVIPEAPPIQLVKPPLSEIKWTPESN